MPDASAPVTTTVEDGVAVVRFDDGKANVLSYTAVDALAAALDRAEADAGSVCIVGRDGRLCAGLDLAVMSAGPDAARDLVAKGGELLMRLFPHPPAGRGGGHGARPGRRRCWCRRATRIGADVPAKIGLNETAIGTPLPSPSPWPRIASNAGTWSGPPSPPRCSTSRARWRPATSTGSSLPPMWSPRRWPRPAGWAPSAARPTPRPRRP